jgi:hypothetical protein
VRTKDIAVPEVPFDPLKLSVQLDQIVVWLSSDQFFELLPQHRDAHRYVEPVQQVLGQRAQVQLQVAHVVAAIGEERDRLFICSPWALSSSASRRFGFVS